MLTALFTKLTVTLAPSTQKEQAESSQAFAVALTASTAYKEQRGTSTPAVVASTPTTQNPNTTYSPSVSSRASATQSGSSTGVSPTSRNSIVIVDSAGIPS
ncbi:hypothetical protein JCM17823_17110 [Halorubrum gandharaense]